MRNLKVTVQYDGTAFVGWQRQDTGVSIQGLLEDALVPIEGAAGRRPRRRPHRCGRPRARAGRDLRTATPPSIPPRSTRALNGVLPPEVRVIAAEEVERRVPRAVQRGRQSLRIPVRQRPVHLAVPSPVRVARARPLDLDAMREASTLLVGTHDFAVLPGLRLARRDDGPDRSIDRVGERGRIRRAARSCAWKGTGSCATWSGTLSARWSTSVRADGRPPT